MKYTKSCTLILLVVLMTILMAACGKGNTSADNQANPTQTTTNETTTPTEKVTNDITPTPTKGPNEESSPEITPETTSTPEETSTPEITPEATPSPETTPEITVEATIQATKTPTKAPTAEVTKVPTAVPTKTAEATKAPTKVPANTSSGNTKQKIRDVIAKVTTSSMSRQEKIRAVHDWLVCNVYYDTTYTQHTPDEVMSKGIAVCTGYSETFQLFMNELGIPCILVTGWAGGDNHEWNAVQMDDGKWYHIDITWDDPLFGGHSDYKDGRNLRYDYFLIPRSVISRDHSIDSIVSSPEGSSMTYNDWVIKTKKAEEQAAEEKRKAEEKKKEIETQTSKWQANNYTVYSAATASELTSKVTEIKTAGKYTFVYTNKDMNIFQIEDCINSNNNLIVTEIAYFHGSYSTTVSITAILFSDFVASISKKTGFPAYYVNSKEELIAAFDAIAASDSQTGVAIIYTERTVLKSVVTGYRFEVNGNKFRHYDNSSQYENGYYYNTFVMVE